MATEIRAREIRLIPISEVRLNPKNRNKHPKKQIERLAEIMSYQGFRRPVTISNRSGLLVAGEGRYLAAKKLGYKEIPATFQDYESGEQEFADAIADNALGLWSELDLAGINDDLGGLDPEFNLDMMGIEDFKRVTAEGFEPQCDEDEVPETPAEPTSKRGDVWQLGKHRVMCGDSTSIDDVEKLMAGEKAEMVFTDPPYNQKGVGGGFIKDRPGMKKLADSNLNSFEPKEFLSVVTVLDPPTFYVHCNKDLIVDYITFAKDQQRLWALLAICKANPIPSKGNNFLSDIEWIIFSRKSGAYFDDGLNYDWYRKAQPVKTKQSEFGHPTEKWVELIEQYLQISSKQSQIVVDLFGGSGTTLIACEKTGRRCYMMELDPRYCDVIVNRWEKYTGKKADLIAENQQEYSNGNRQEDGRPGL